MRVQDASSTNFLLVDRQLSCERLADLLQMTNPSAVVAVIGERHAALWRTGEVLTRVMVQPLSAAFDFLRRDASRHVPIHDADFRSMRCLSYAWLPKRASYPASITAA